MGIITMQQTFFTPEIILSIVFYATVAILSVASAFGSIYFYAQDDNNRNDNYNDVLSRVNNDTPLQDNVNL